MPKVLIVEEDEVLLSEMSQWLADQYFTTERATTGSAGQKLLADHLYDVIILDWDLSNPAGASLCKWFRAKGGTSPLLMLTKQDRLDDILDAFAAGADDCLSKPFALRELTVRIRALRRRDLLTYPQLIHHGPLTIDSTMHRASVSGHMLSLTPTEFALLEHFVHHPGNVFGPSALLNKVWKDAAGSSSDTVRAYIKRLRQKLEAVGARDLIENVHGVGYRMTLSTNADLDYIAPLPATQISFLPY